jgi:hypothetical protein
VQLVLDPATGGQDARLGSISVVGSDQGEDATITADLLSLIDHGAFTSSPYLRPMIH